MRRPTGLAFIFSIAASVTDYAAAADNDRPRGVGPEYAKFYKDSSTFTCISNPSIKIPLSAVNDDYCDCPDGSDEPGTSACAYLSPYYPDFISDPGEPGANKTPALPGYYCKNKGHNPAYIPFQRVNDGVCDYEACCDGSDEWARVGGVKCENRCKEIGKEWRKEEEKRQKAHTAAVRRRKELVESAARMRKEVEDRVADLEVEIQASEEKVQDLEAELDDVRSKERRKATKGKKESKTSMLAEAAKLRVENLRTALIDLRSQREEEHSRLVELEGILSKFKEEYNPNFNDEGVKAAVRSWEEYAARQAEDEDEINAPDDQRLDELCQEDNEESGINWAQWESEDDEGKTKLAYKIIAYLPDSLAKPIEKTLAGLHSWLVSNGIIADNSGDSEESKAVKDARKRLETAKSELKSVKSQIKDNKADLEKDFGKDGVFRALKGSCVEKNSGEYTYELCWMDKARQKPKRGGATNMGSFAAVSSMSVDESTSSGQIIPQERVTLQYNSGQTCWNGPPRSTTVILQCGETDEILKIAEDEKCVYSMHVATPAVCGPSRNGSKDSNRKDEL